MYVEGRCRRGGKVTGQTGAFANPFRYAGEYQDDESGLYYLSSRFYQPEIGRFLTQDTWKGSAWLPWTQNLYAYVGNNPVNLIDPTGHCAEGVCDDQNTGGTYDGTPEWQGDVPEEWKNDYIRCSIDWVTGYGSNGHACKAQFPGRFVSHDEPLTQEEAIRQYSLAGAMNPIAALAAGGFVWGVSKDIASAFYGQGLTSFTYEASPKHVGLELMVPGTRSAMRQTKPCSKTQFVHPRGKVALDMQWGQMGRYMSSVQLGQK